MYLDERLKVQEIADFFNIHIDTIQNYIKKLHLKRNKLSKAKIKDLEQFKKLYKTNIPINILAEKYQVDRRTIRNTSKHLGLEARYVRSYVS